jgi:hypothetical protein
MAVITHLETDTGTNVDISGATAVGAYTANGDKLIMVDVSIDAVAGNGDYVMYVTRQIGGSGSAYRILPQTTMTAASGLTAISGQSGWITVRNGDVLTCYVDGLAGDTSTPDWSTRWFESAVTLVTLADDAITAAKFDESTAFPLKSADTGTTKVARVGADGDTLETLSDQLDTVQTDLDNPSQYKADVSGLATSSALATVDTVVDGIATTLANPDNFKADVSALALESTLTAMKGAGWSTETLAAIKSAIDALSSGGVDPAVIAAAILDALLADHTVAGSVAKTIADILEDTGTTLSNLITSIKAKTDLMDASAITYTPNVVGTAITLLRGDTFSATLTDVGALTGYVSIDFTVKRNTSNTDDEAVIRIRKNASGTGDGLLRLNRAAPTTETGEIVIDDEATGDITITLDETATDGLEVGAYLYDVQLITATAVKTLTSGRLNVTSDVTRAIA